uniref:Isocitrate dehydrogenase (NADP(+)) n=1 Tax=Aplanochytrium stocchinoi TaxID=215587 RepID=A0A7S3PJM8_9STRA
MQSKMLAALQRHSHGLQLGRFAQKTARQSFHTSKPLQNKIVYTHTDEAPALATYSFLPIIRKFAEPAGVKVDLADISVASRIVAQWNDKLPDHQKVPDTLSALGELCLKPEANIIKLPNISASVPQLNEAIAELQEQGYDIPSYTQTPGTPEEKDAHSRYAKVLGSVVNPVLREGNSDRRVAGPVKEYSQKHPHRMMKPYSPDCRASVAHMEDGDFFSSEQSTTMEKPCKVQIEFIGNDGENIVLKEFFSLEAGEILDAATMDCGKLCEFFDSAINKAKEEDMLLSLHLKATMMKVSDPIMFGHMVKVYYKDVFEKHASLFERIGVNPNNGVGDVYEKIATLPNEERLMIETDILEVYKTRPKLAMVNSAKGITNLHVPSDVIVDASMPNVARDGGKMWGEDDDLHETTCIIPDRCYAGIYQEVLKFCKENGAFDPATMGTVNNVGLMAQKAEEYGSHDKTFEISADGSVQVVNDSGDVVFTHTVRKGDIWRACQTKDAPIKDWVGLAVRRSRASGYPAIFWLNSARAHDAEIIKKIEKYLPEFDTSGLDISIMTPEQACVKSMRRAKDGENTISVTGNVLRDYLTDLFPILELGTSAKMLSVVPMLAGGGMYETGAGGSAPKHAQQFVEEGHLRWDSLGEFLALAVSLQDLSEKTNNPKAKILGDTLNQATSTLMNTGKSPSRKVNEIDNRGSHFYLAMYWAEALANQTEDPALASEFKDLAKTLAENEETIAEELIKCQGKPMDIGGYYQPDPKKVENAMRPSKTLNAIIG